jgi:hypothetical protein
MTAMGRVWAMMVVEGDPAPDAGLGPAPLVVHFPTTLLDGRKLCAVISLPDPSLTFVLVRDDQVFKRVVELQLKLTDASGNDWPDLRQVPLDGFRSRSGVNQLPNEGVGVFSAEVLQGYVPGNR